MPQEKSHLDQIVRQSHDVGIQANGDFTGDDGRCVADGLDLGEASELQIFYNKSIKRTH